MSLSYSTYSQITNCTLGAWTGNPCCQGGASLLGSRLQVAQFGTNITSVAPMETPFTCAPQTRGTGTYTLDTLCRTGTTR